MNEGRLANPASSVNNDKFKAALVIQGVQFVQLPFPAVKIKIEDIRPLSSLLISSLLKSSISSHEPNVKQPQPTR